MLLQPFFEKQKNQPNSGICILQLNDRSDVDPHADKAAVVLYWGLKGLLPVNADEPTCISQSREHQEKAAASHCWIYHALNMSSSDLKHTSPLIASASLT